MMLIAVDRILPNPQQPRKTFDQAELESLAESVREDQKAGGTGVIQAITVEEAEDGWFILQDGERRLRAARLANLAEIPASIAPPLNGTAARDRLVRALVANVQREDLNPIDEARGYQELKNQGMSVDAIARRMGIYRVRIDSRLKLLRLDAPIQEMIASGQLSRDIRLADALMAIPNAPARLKMALSLAKKQVALKPAVAACGKIARKLGGVADPESQRRASLRLAGKRAHADRLPTREWNMLFQLNRVPPWQVVSEAAMGTCDMCALQAVASEETCGQCPAVILLAKMLEGANKKVRQWKTSTQPSRQ